MARSNSRTGTPKWTSLWSRLARALGIFAKPAVARVKHPSARKRKKTGHNTHLKHHKGRHAAARSHRRGARYSQNHRRHAKPAYRSGRHAARHATRYRSALRHRGSVLSPKSAAQASLSLHPSERSVWHVPYLHLPKILFTRIELPQPHLPNFHRRKRVQKSIEAREELPVSSEESVPATFAASGIPKKVKFHWSFWGTKKKKSAVTVEDSAAGTSAFSQKEIVSESPKDDLADLLAKGDESDQAKHIPEKTKKKQQESEEISAGLLEKQPETKRTSSPEPNQKETVVAQGRTDVVGAKSKKSQERDIVVQLPVQNAKKKAETKKTEKQVGTPETPDAEQVLHDIEERVARRKQKKSLGSFFRSLNYVGMGRHRSAFVQNLALMLSAGLPLVDALQTIQAEIRSRAMRALVQRILDLVEGGNPLWVSMDEQRLFSPYEVSLVRVGEEAGNLARNMEYLSVQQEKDRNLRQKVKMAMIYPTIVLILMFIMVMGLGMFILPNLIQVLYALNVELPLSTRLVIGFTKFMQKSGAQTGGGIIGAFLIVLLLTKYTSFKVITQWFIFRIPGIGRLAREASIARFGVILGGLLQAGVPLVESMDSMVEVTTVVSFKRFYRTLRDRVVVGDSFATCFHTIRGSQKILPISVQQLIITGEKSGALSDTCLKVAHIYERKAEETAGKLPVILEPTLLLGIGGLVGFIAFSIIVPIYSAVGNVGGG